jgi:hypothetical protein
MLMKNNLTNTDKKYINKYVLNTFKGSVWGTMPVLIQLTF